MNRTYKIKLSLNKEDQINLSRLMIDYTSMFNLYVNWCFEVRGWSKKQAHKDLYEKIKTQFPEVPTGIIQSCRDQAIESVKSQKLKHKPEKFGYSSIRYDLRTCTLRGNKLTISSTGNRVKLDISIPSFAKDIIENWTFKGLTLKKTKKGEFYAHLILFKETPELLPETNILGIDLGLKNIMVTSEGEIFKGNKLRSIKRKYLYIKRNLQRKDTRSSTRRLKTLSGRELRFTLDQNHVLSKQLVKKDFDTFVLEDLKGIKIKNKGRKINKMLHQWSFYQLITFIKYKAEILGKSVTQIDPSYTSQTCNICGHIDKTNRIKSKFLCKSCGHTDHADINAAKNIKNKYISSMIPKGTSDEQGAVNHPTMPDSSLETTASIGPRARCS